MKKIQYLSVMHRKTVAAILLSVAMVFSGAGFAFAEKQNLSEKIVQIQESKDEVKSEEIAKLTEGNWAPHTYKALNRLIEENGIKNPKYNPQQRPYVVFDFDNTSAINDVQEALLVYQIEHLKFAIQPEKMQVVLETGIPDVDKKFSKDYHELTVKTVAGDIARDYEYLYNNYEGFISGGKKSLDDIKETNEYKDFAAKLRFLYDAVNDTFDASVGYPWVTYLFAGMTSDEVYALAKDSHSYWTNYKLFEKIKWTSPEDLPGDAGVVSVSYKTGIHFTPELRDLYSTLMKNGIDVYVCSASFIDVIQAAAYEEEFGFNVPKGNVYAMMLKKDHDGKYLNEYNTDYFQTQGEGKTKTIMKFIAPKYQGAGPIMVAGDSAGDYNMMTDFADMKLGLLFNRYRKDSTKALAQEAVKTMGKVDAKYVLQGRDENAGILRPSERSIMLTESVLVRE